MRAKPRTDSSSTSVHRRTAWLLVIVVLGTVPLLAQAKTPWVPFDCVAPAPGQPGPGEDDGAGAPTERPLLQSDEAVVRRFETEIRASLFGSRWQALVDDLGRSALDAVGLGGFVDPPAGDPARSALAEALRTGAVQIRVERVADWRRRRCSEAPDRRMLFYVEATWSPPADASQDNDSDTRPRDAPPAARTFSARLAADGTLQEWGMGQALSDDGPPAPALFTLVEAGAQLATHAGGPLGHLQYVLATGYPACYAIPCVAGTRNGTLYLLDRRGTAFAFSLTPHPEREVLPPRGHRCLGAPCPGDPWVLEIGDRILAGELLNPPPGCSPHPARSPAAGTMEAVPSRAGSRP